MSIAITRDTFTAADYAAFAERISQQVSHLARLCDQPGFGDGPTTIGAELELPLVGDDWRPKPCNIPVLESLGDPRATVEIARFNLELNLSPVPAEGRPFTAIGRESPRRTARACCRSASFRRSSRPTSPARR
jgi:hypothetical protein